MQGWQGDLTAMHDSHMLHSVCQPQNQATVWHNPVHAQIDLMYTQLTKGSGELAWYPNTQLQQMALINVSRSGPRWEGYSWLLDLDTPNEVRSWGL
jgi:hypothetical protein